MNFFKALLIKYNPEALHQAVLAQDIDRVEHLLSTRPSLLNCYDAQGFTPLHHSLVYKSSKITLLLLEAQANPNLDCNYSARKGHILLDAFHFDRLDQVKLLIWYGAEINNTLIKKPQHQEIYQKFHTLYLKKLDLEKEIQQPSSTMETKIEAYRKLSALLETLISAETNQTFKQHYQQQAANYGLKANELKWASPSRIPSIK